MHPAKKKLKYLRSLVKKFFTAKLIFEKMKPEGLEFFYGFYALPVNIFSAEKDVVKMTGKGGSCSRILLGDFLVAF